MDSANPAVETHTTRRGTPEKSSTKRSIRYGSAISRLPLVAVRTGLDGMCAAAVSHCRAMITATAPKNSAVSIRARRGERSAAHAVIRKTAKNVACVT
jgi:hypothetical protein